jgi:hypothetical protein
MLATMLFGTHPSATECVTSLEEPLICGALTSADAVFLADVEDSRAVTDVGRTDVTFRIVEAFKGVKVGVQTLRMMPAIGSYSFPKGQRVLVYAHVYDGAWTTVCSRTRAADDVGGELETLRALVKGKPGGLVDGHVVTADGANNHPGLRVTLRSESGQQVVQAAATTGAGHFKFDWVAPGAYTLVIEGGTSFRDERRTVAVRRVGTCLTIPTIVLRRRT